MRGKWRDGIHVVASDAKKNTGDCKAVDAQKARTVSRPGSTDRVYIS